MTGVRRRWLAIFGVALFAILACLSGLDRKAEQQPALSRLVPPPFRSHAARAEAAQALLAGNAPAATDASRNAIRADPLDRRGPALLGAVAASQGDDLAAASAFGVADRMARREPIVQAWFFGQAMERGDYGGAATRIDAMLRTHPDLPLSRRFLADLEARPAGRREVMRRLADNPPWADAYLAERTGTPRASDQQGWLRHPTGDVRISGGSRDDEPFTFSSRASVTRLMLSKPVSLDPGDYRMVARVDEIGKERVQASLDCGEPRRPSWGSGALASGQMLRAEACDTLVLGIWLRPGEGAVTFDAMRIERVNP